MAADRAGLAVAGFLAGAGLAVAGDGLPPSQTANREPLGELLRPRLAIHRYGAPLHAQGRARPRATDT